MLSEKEPVGSFFRREHSASITLFVRWSIGLSIGPTIPILLRHRRVCAWFKFLLFPSFCGVVEIGLFFLLPTGYPIPEYFFMTNPMVIFIFYFGDVLPILLFLQPKNGKNIPFWLLKAAIT
jgi:hypothetical protein